MSCIMLAWTENITPKQMSSESGWWVLIHAKARKINFMKIFKGCSDIQGTRNKVPAEIGIKGKSVIQLGCVIIMGL